MLLILPQHKKSEVDLVETQPGECMLPLHHCTDHCDQFDLRARKANIYFIHSVGKEDGESVLDSFSVANMRRS